MNDLQKLHLKNMLSQRSQDTKEYEHIVYDSIYMKFMNR